MRIALMLLWQPVLLRRSMGTPWVQWLLLALTAGLTILALLFQTKSAALFACIVGAVLLVVWWGLFVISIGLQFAPRGARLVPRLRRIALATTILVCLCLLLIVTLVGGGVFGHHALWALLAGLGLCAVALLVTGRDTLGFIALLPLALVLAKFHEFVDIAAPLATPAVIAGGAALLGVSMWCTLRLVLDTGDSASGYGKFLELWSPAVRGTQAQQGSLMKPFAAAYARCLRQDCARRDRQNLLMHALGPYLHWTGTLNGQLVLLLVSAAFCLIPILYAASRVEIVVGSMMAWQFLLQLKVANLAAGQPEHALLRLAPGMPGSNALNRTLARGLLGLFFKNWITAMCCAALLLALVDVSRTQFIAVMSSLSASVLLAAGMLRNFAVANKIRDEILLGLLLVLTFSLMRVIYLVPSGMFLENLTGLQAPGVGPLGMLLITLSVMLLAGLIVAWRWRVVLAAPPAFPVGRI